MKIIDQLRAGVLPAPSLLLDELSVEIALIGQLADTPQDAEWHAEGSVRIHTEMVLQDLFDQLQSGAIECEPEQQVGLIIGAALHDIGKAVTTREEPIEGRVRIISPHHAERGCSLVAPLLKRLGMYDTEIDLALGIIRYHHDPKRMVLRSAENCRYHQLARSVDLRLLHEFEKCDIRGRICSDPEEQLEILELFRSEAESFGLWGREQPYEQWRSLFDREIDEPSQKRYAYLESIRLFEAGEIRSPEEGLGKTWQHRSDYGEVIILSAPSASGKSTLVEELVAHHQGKELDVISLDQLRAEITGKRADQSKNGQVLQLGKERLREALRSQRSVIWDSTGLRRDARGMVAQLGYDYHCLVSVIGLAVPMATSMKRNRKREHAIPQAILEKQYRNWQWPANREAHEVEFRYRE